MRRVRHLIARHQREVQKKRQDGHRRHKGARPCHFVRQFRWLVDIRLNPDRLDNLQCALLNTVDAVKRLAVTRTATQ